MTAQAALDPGFAARSLGEIAVSLPGATAIFRRHKLDFCCGGGASLAEASARRGAPLAEIEADLAALAPAAAEAPQETEALIDLIEGRYHATHRRELPELIRLARRVEAVHGDREEAPHGLAELLSAMEAELGDHMAKEEGVLFPLMRRGGHPMITHPIGMMRHEHDGHAEHLRALDRLTTGGVPPAGACNSWRALYAGTRKLADDLVEHMHIENNILFPRFEA
ncbi:iron-sulfur cluster repair di-iron protein [Falsiroseomonas sp. CW058]|uniref:iron-sulfur cluster repair di-iron protein n=1 Tax=Falsiroseomonas sp. CW058 TaxID=3388664 RepID=UPI003D318662